jgi:hypothetical protein
MGQDLPISLLPSLSAATNETLIAVVYSGVSGNTTYQMTTQDFIKSIPFGTMYQDWIPDVTNTYSIGTSGKTIQSIHVGAGTVFIGPNGALGIDDTGVLFSLNGFATNFFVLGAVTESGVTTTSGVTFTVSGDDVIFAPVSGQTFNLNKQLIPTGGTTGQVFTKTGGTSYEWGWTTLTGTSGTSGTNGTSGTSSTGGTRYHGAFYSDVTQTLSMVNGPQVMSANTTTASSGVVLSANTRFVALNSGVYNLQFSAQLSKTSSNTDEVAIWFRKNGVDIPQTNTEMQVAKQGTYGKLVAAWNFIERLNTNDYLEIVWASADITYELLAESAKVSPYVKPATPSIIVTVTQV